MVLNKHSNVKASPQKPHWGEAVLTGHSCSFGCQSLSHLEADVEELGKQKLYRTYRDGSLIKRVSRKGRRACLCMRI